MALVPLKTKSELVGDLIAYIRSRQPKADITPGSVMRDLLIESPAELIYNSQVLAEFISRLNNFADLYDLLRDRTYKAQVATGLGIDLVEVERIISQTIEGYAANFGIIRKTGQKASTIITFSSTTRPSSEYTIPAGTAIQTSNVSNALTFKTMQDAVIPANPDNSSYLNTENGQWEIHVPAEAINEGSEYNIPPNTITRFKEENVVSKEVTVTNRVSASGGIDEESDAELLNRITYAYRGNFSGTPASILSSILGLSYVSDADIVYQINDPARIRESLYDIDVWITGFDSTLAISEVEMPSDPYIKIPNTPVQKVIEVEDLTVSYVFTPNMYEFDQDKSSIYRYSSNAMDRIVFKEVEPTVTLDESTVKLALPAYQGQPVPFISEFGGNPIDSTRLAVYINSDSTPDNGWKYSTTGGTIEKTFDSSFEVLPKFTVKQMPAVSDTVKIQYVYNSRIKNAQDFITSDSRLFLGQDILVREARPVPIVIDVTVQSDGTRSTQDIEENIRNVLQKDIVDLKLAKEINASDLVVLIRSVPGVIDVQIPFTKLYRAIDQNGNSVTTGGSGDILLSRFEYATIQSITVTIVTSRVVS